MAEVSLKRDVGMFFVVRKWPAWLSRSRNGNLSFTLDLS